MRPTRHVTAVMLLAAFGAAGCSKEKTPPSNQASKDAAQTTAAPKATSGLLTAADGEKLESTVAPNTSSSFADGEAAYASRKYGEATAIFERYVANRPKNPWGHYMLGLSAWKNGDPAKSEQAFEQALSLDGSHVKSLVNESRLFIDQKRYDDAIDRLMRASEIDPESSVVFRLLGRTYTAKGDTEQAAAAYSAAREADARKKNLARVEAVKSEPEAPVDAEPAGTK